MFLLLYAVYKFGKLYCLSPFKKDTTKDSCTYFFYTSSTLKSFHPWNAKAMLFSSVFPLSCYDHPLSCEDIYSLVPT